MSKPLMPIEKNASPAAAPTWADVIGAVPLDLKAELAKVDIAPEDRIIVHNLPDGAALTVGQRRPDGSWFLLPGHIYIAEYVPPPHNGRSAEITISVIAPDPSDPARTTTKARCKVSLRITPAAPSQASPQTADSVIDLRPRLKSRDTVAESVRSAPATLSALDGDRRFAAYAAKWQSHLREIFETAERRLKASQIEQLAWLRVALAYDQVAQGSGAEAQRNDDLDRRAEAPIPV